MFKHNVSQFFRRLGAAGLNLLKVQLYIIGAPVLVVFMVYGTWFIVAAFLWIVLVDAAFICAILAFMASFFTGIVALFNPDLWSTIAGWWSWIWSWFASGNVALWPHFVRSLPLYMLSGLILALLYEGINRLTAKVRSIRLRYGIA